MFDIIILWPTNLLCSSVTIFCLWPFLTIRAINQLSLVSEIDWWAHRIVHILEIISSWEKNPCHNGTVGQIRAVYSSLICWSDQALDFRLFYYVLHNVAKPCFSRTFYDSRSLWKYSLQSKMIIHQQYFYVYLSYSYALLKEIICRSTC